LKFNLQGRLDNTHLSEGNGLLPVFEAVVNSFHSLQEADRFNDMGEIRVEIDRQRGLTPDDLDGFITGFSVTDNGAGFNDQNFTSFWTSDSRHKATRGGKGIGRFLWLKAFGWAEIESHFETPQGMKLRAFKFNAGEYSEEPVDEPYASSRTIAKTTVALKELKDPWRSRLPRDPDAIVFRMIEHCLLFLLQEKCPSLVLVDGAREINIRDVFDHDYVPHASHLDFEVGGERFHFRGLRLYSSQATFHELKFAAHSRVVTTERLFNLIPNLRRKLSDDRGPYFYFGFVESSYLNQKVNGERTRFDIPNSVREIEGFFGPQITFDGIRAGAVDRVRHDLSEVLQSLNQEKAELVHDYIAKAPQYRPLLRIAPEVIDQLPPGASEREVDETLHGIMFEQESRLRSEARDLVETVLTGPVSHEEYLDQLNSWLDKSNEIGVYSLAQYVAHRKVVLDLLEKSLEWDMDTGRYPRENQLHSLIFPMQTTSNDVRPGQGNLWVVDERLSFHEYLTSDKSFLSSGPLSSTSRLRPDLLLFNGPHGFSESKDGPLPSIVLVEFKRPGRTGYNPEEDPLSQVFDMIEELRRGNYRTPGGRIITLADGVPAYLYVICTITDRVRTAALRSTLDETPDRMGYFGYVPGYKAYVEIISYDKLLLDAQKRNKVLFDQLFLPS
jgi:hypothetical protein